MIEENINELIRVYLQHCQLEKRLSPKTIKAYRIDLSQFSNYLGCNIYVCDKAAIQNYLSLLHSQYKVKSVKRKIATPGLNCRLLGTSYIVQEYIEGFECEVPVFKVGNAVYVFPPIGIDLQGKNILDENASENNQYGFYKLDKCFPSEVVTTIQETAEKAFRLLQMDVYGRIDFRITPNGQPFIFDVSTTPYTTRHSSFAYAFKQLGFIFLHCATWISGYDANVLTCFMSI